MHGCARSAYAWQGKNPLSSETGWLRQKSLVLSELERHDKNFDKVEIGMGKFDEKMQALDKRVTALTVKVAIGAAIITALMGVAATVLVNLLSGG